MGIALNAFGWAPEVFWRATPAEFHAMVEARQEANRQMDQAAR